MRLQIKILELERVKRFSISEIKHDSKLVSFYTGLQNYSVFCWMFNHIKEKAKGLHYFRGDSSFTLKSHQICPNKSKSGKKRQVLMEDEMFMTLVRLRLGLTEKDLAFRFKVSQTSISQILTTWITFLGRELEGLIGLTVMKSHSITQNAFKITLTLLELLTALKGLLKNLT